MVKLVYTRDLKSRGLKNRVGSIPASGTMVTPLEGLAKTYNATLGRVTGTEAVIKRYFVISNQNGTRGSLDPLGDLTLAALNQPTRAAIVEKRIIVFTKRSV